MDHLAVAQVTSVICRIGSLESEDEAIAALDVVICRIGSLEIGAFDILKYLSCYLPYRQLRKR